MGRIVYIDCGETMRAALDAGLAHLVPDLVVHDGDPDAATLERLLADAEIVLDGHTRLDRQQLAAATELRHVVFLGTGADFYIAPEDAAAAGVGVHTIRGYGDQAVAEHTLALAFAVARRVAWMDAEIRAGRWSRAGGVELAGRTFGVIGTGGIGRAVARLAHGVGMEVVAWSRSGVPEDLPATAVDDVDTLLAQADVVSLHLAETPGTRGFLDARRLDLLREGAILLNTARGSLVDETALLARLDAGRLFGCGLDVFADEPLPPDHPLRRHDRVVLTPHAAFNTDAAAARLLRQGLERAAALRAGG